MTADHERARTIRARAKRWPVAPEVVESEFPQPWRGYGVLAQIVFFLLTSVAVAAFYFLTNEALLTATLCLAIAELLIRRMKWFGTGVESSLWLGGLLSALMALPSSDSAESLLLIAAAAAMAGLRVRNPLFGVLAASFVARYFEVMYDLGTLVALLIAAGALAALYRTWKRPSTEWLFSALLVLMPLAGWEHAGRRWLATTIVFYGGFALLALVSALVKRHHAMFAGAATSAIVAVSTAHDYVHPPAELTFVFSGGALLAAAWVVARALRGETAAFTMSRSALTAFDDDLQTVGTFAVATSSAGNPPEQPQDHGGRFGGGGATGDY